MELAFGYLNWTPSVFWDATWSEFACAVRGVREYGIITAISKMLGGKSSSWKSRELSKEEALTVKEAAEDFDRQLVESGVILRFEEAARALKRGRSKRG